MSNRLKVAMIDVILSLHRKGWSQRRIAAELDINRETVARYLKRARAAAKPAIASSGSDSPEPAAKPAIASSGSDSPEPAAKPAIAPPALIAPRSRRMLMVRYSLRPVTMAAGLMVVRATASRGGRLSSPSAIRA